MIHQRPNRSTPAPRDCRIGAGLGRAARGDRVLDAERRPLDQTIVQVDLQPLDVELRGVAAPTAACFRRGSRSSAKMPQRARLTVPSVALPLGSRNSMVPFFSLPGPAIAIDHEIVEPVLPRLRVRRREGDREIRISSVVGCLRPDPEPPLATISTMFCVTVNESIVATRL